MATYNKTVSTHQSLAAATVDVVTLAAKWQQVEVLNRGAVEIYARVDGTDPTVGGDDCYVIPAGSAGSISTPGSNPSTVHLIASAACAYSVTGAGS